MPASRRGLVLLLGVFIAALSALSPSLVLAKPMVEAPNLSARDDLEVQTILDVNAARMARGLAPLYADASLGELARERSFDMAAHNYFSHYAPDGTAFYVRLLDDSHIAYTYAGENLAWNTYGDDVSAQTAVNGWIASPPHAENLFSADYTRAGIGVVSIAGKKYFTLIFVGD